MTVGATLFYFATRLFYLFAIKALHSRGAKPKAPKPFADVFNVAGRIVEVPHKVEPNTLAERLACFDLGLSAVGVEHQPNGTWSALIHPLAYESARRQEILLIKPLINWRYALTTLERIRRYAQELNYSVPRCEEAEIWELFESHPPETRAELIERYQETGLGGFGVVEDIKRLGF